MKKEEVFVLIDSEEKRLRAIQILKDAEEVIYKYSDLLEVYYRPLNLSFNNNEWCVMFRVDNEIKITVDQLEELLNPNYAVTEVNLSVEELRLQAEKLGFELTKMKREIKVGDFGIFWDNDEPEISCFGFLTQRNDIGFKDNFHTTSWENFRYLTEEEKQKIQENW